LLLRPRRSTLFPYTTLFRSSRAPAWTWRVLPVRWVEGRGPWCSWSFPESGVVVGGVVLRGIPVRELELADVHRGALGLRLLERLDRKSTRLNSSHVSISYAV